MQSSRPDYPPDHPLFRDINTIEIGSLRLDPGGFTATVKGHDIPLTLGEFLILRELAQNPYQVLRRERLAMLLRSTNSNSDVHGSSLRSVDTHISRLRTKLRLAGYNCIKTMRFVGYRFLPEGG